MRKLVSTLIVLSLTVLAFSALVGCNKKNGSTSSTVYGFNYSVTTSKDAGEGYQGFATVKKYVLTDEQTKALAVGNYYGNTFDLVIPEEYVTKSGEKYKVNAIDDGAFANQLLIKSVKIGPHITEVGEGCLAGCANLNTLEISFAGASADAINNKKTVSYLFGTSEADGTTAVTTYYNGGDSGNSATYYIPTALKTVILTGDTVGEYAFNGLNVQNIVLNGNVTEIGAYAFANTTGVKSVKLPATVTKIGKGAFESSSVTSVNFAALTALDTIGADAFKNASSFGKTVDVVLPASVTTIGAGAFYSCASLKKVDLSACALTAIPENAFYSCKALEEAKLPAVTSIGKGAFILCEKLEKTALTVDGTEVTDAYGAGVFDEGFFA